MENSAPENAPSAVDEIKVVLTRNGSESFECTFCQKRFGGKSQCKRHITMNHITGPFNCVDCKAEFLQPSEFRAHSKQHSRKKRGNEAGEKTRRKSPSDPVEYCCQLCSAVYRKLASYKQHLDKHAGIVPQKVTLPCEQCDAVFTSREGRRVHMILKHNAGTTYKCQECPMIFARKGNLRLHMTTHGVRQHVCSICGMSYARLESLKTHETACAEGNIGLCCNVCGQRFRKQELLEKHKQQGHREKEFQCTHCGHGFETRRALSHHVRIHEGTFRCEYCPLQFVTEKALRNHEQCRHWEDLGIERVVGKQGRRKDAPERPKEPKVRVRRNKNNPFLGLEHLAEEKESSVGVVECPCCELKAEGEGVEESNEMTSTSKGATDENDFGPMSIVGKNEETVEDAKVVNTEVHTRAQLDNEDDESALKHEPLDVSDQDDLIEDDSADDHDETNEQSAEQDIFEDVELKQQEQRTPLKRTRVRRHRQTKPAERKSKVKNPYPKKFSCEDCDKSFAHQYWLYLHRVKVHGVEEKTVPLPKKHRTHYCEHCSKCFSDWRNLMYHLKHIHGIQVDEMQLVKCSSCRRRFLSKADMEGHSCLKGTHFNREPKYKCELCDKPYYSKHGLESHKSSHPEYHRINCDVCQKPFANEKDMLYHKKRVHVEANLVCEVCGKSFKVQSQLKIHVQIHQDVKGYQCEFCGKSFSQRNGMTAHLRIAHAEQLGEEAMAEREITCEVCGKKLKGKICFRLHMKIHSNDRNYHCSYCDKKFISKQDQTRHEQTHTKEYRFKCRFCDKGSTRRKLILLHEAREHNFVSPNAAGPSHECSICGKCFSSPSALKIHESLHSDDLPVRCKLCDSRFKNVKYLKYHLKAHHPADGSVKVPRKRKAPNIAQEMTKEDGHLRIGTESSIQLESQQILQDTVQVTLPVTNADGSSSVVLYSVYEIQPPPS